MSEKNISSVLSVGNHSAGNQCIRHTSVYIEVKSNINVQHVVNHLVLTGTVRNTSVSIQVTNLINVLPVVNHLVNCQHV